MSMPSISLDDARRRVRQAWCRYVLPAYTSRDVATLLAALSTITLVAGRRNDISTNTDFSSRRSTVRFGEDIEVGPEARRRRALATWDRATVPRLFWAKPW